MKNILILSFFVMSLSSYHANSQSSLDVLRISDQKLIGTGRAAGTNTNLGGIGADFTSLSFNPAGIAQYRKSEFMISPTVTSSTMESTLLNGSEGNPIKDDKTKFRLPNLGLVIAGSKNSKSSFAFGIGVNGFMGNSNNSTFKGDSKGSISDRFAALGSGLDLSELDNFEAGLAYDTEVLIEQRPDGSYSYDYEDYGNQELNKYQNVQSNGRYNELAMSGGVNLSNKFLLGATIGVPIYRYNETKTYQELDNDDNVPFFQELVFREYKTQAGSGINVKAGIIYKPINNLLIGASIHSPSFIAITEDFSTALDYDFVFNNELNSNSVESPEGTIDYTVTTPMKLQGSIGGILGKFGFVNAEVEYQDNSTSKIKIDSDNIFDIQIQDNINREIKANYRGTVKVNFGAEVAAIPNFRLRAGIGFAQSPYVSDSEFLPSIGFGAGYRSDYFFIDLGYRQWKSENSYQPYYITEDVSNEIFQTSVLQKLTQRAFVLTIGFKMM